MLLALGWTRSRPPLATRSHGCVSVLPAKTCPEHHDPAIVLAMLRWHSDEAPPPLQCTITEEEAGERLTRVAGNRFALLGSKSQAENAVKRSALLVNGEVVEKSRKVKAGDELSLQPLAVAAPDSKRLESRARFVEHLRSQGLRVLYEDDAAAVVFKPAGIHTKAGSNPKFAALEDALTAELSPPLDSDDALPLPMVMHRLDVPVSGLCLVAKTRGAAMSLSKQFETRGVQKVYHALLVGEPDAPSMELTSPVDGLPSHSSLEVLSVTEHAQWGHLTWVRMMPHTGRTHQLRVHAASIGCPMVGDDLYWELAAEARRTRAAAHPEERPLPPIRKSGGLFLQSCGVTFTHPDESKGTVQVAVAEAPKFAALLARARGSVDYLSVD